jgi:hypothetical protein
MAGRRRLDRQAEAEFRNWAEPGRGGRRVSLGPCRSRRRSASPSDLRLPRLPRRPSARAREPSRYTFSVTDVPDCPHRSAMSLRDTPSSDSSDTKLWGSSRGVQSAGLRPAALGTRRQTTRRERKAAVLDTPHLGCANPDTVVRDRHSYDCRGRRPGRRAHSAHKHRRHRREPCDTHSDISCCLWPLVGCPTRSKPS